MTPTFLQLWIKALRHRSEHGDEDPRDATDPDAEIADTIWRLGSVGAWCGRATLASDKTIARDIVFARSIGLGRLDVMINDHAASRGPRMFDTYGRDRIIAVASAAASAGLTVHLTTWVMPHRDYILGMCETANEIAASVPIASVCLDAEEPWTQARTIMGYEAAASLIASEMRVPWGVTGIGYASVPRLEPLVSRAAYIAPQCYATSGNALDPATVAPTLCGRWRKAFSTRLPLVVGLAAYRQGGRLGLGKAEMIRAAFVGAVSCMPADIVYWSLRHIRSDATVAKAIADVCKMANVRMVSQ